MKQLAFFYLLLFTGNVFSQTDTVRVKNHLTNITKTETSRNHSNIKLLNGIADYIMCEFKIHHAKETSFQEYEVNGKTYKNVIASYGNLEAPRIIVGAHYDVCGFQEGADDNASGVVGLLELARLLDRSDLGIRIDLVAYTLEEPPYFRTEFMGSHIHSKYLVDNNIDVIGMVCLEMIGYFDDAKKSQDYPLGLLKLFYGSKGDYITVVKKPGGGKFARKYTKAFKSQGLIKTKKFVGPTWLPGVDFSDHLNYWKYNFSALMITDTAFYRNKNYHEKGDVMEALDIQRMSKVIDTVFASLLKMNKKFNNL